MEDTEWTENLGVFSNFQLEAPGLFGCISVPFQTGGAHVMTPLFPMVVSSSQLWHGWQDYRIGSVIYPLLELYSRRMIEDRPIQPRHIMHFK